MMENRFFNDDFLTPANSGNHAVRLPVAHDEPKSALRSAFPLGTVIVVPATRTIEGQGDSVTLEPRVMQVLLLMADRKGSVVTRAEFVAECWNGRIVGEDSLNRAISGLRRALALVAANSLTVETIPKTGYRLVISKEMEVPAALFSMPLASRRTLILAVASVAAVGSIGIWTSTKQRDPQVQALMDEGERALREQISTNDQQGVDFFRKAVALAPDDADAWGLLALGLSTRVEHSPADQISATITACQAAAQRALSINARQGNAHAAIALLMPIFGDWANVERRLRNVIAIDARNISTLAQLGVLLQSTGRVGAALEQTSRAAALAPMAPAYQYRQAYQQWSNGRLGEADRTIDRAVALWPTHSGVWYSRLVIFAMTARPDAALTMLDQAKGKPIELRPPMALAWRTTLTALKTKSSTDRATAVAAIRAIATKSAAGAVNAILCLAGLRALNEAFEVAEGFYLRRGPALGEVITAGPIPTAEQRARKTMLLFLPVAAPMRADPRFARLMTDVGLTDYWRAVGVVPDYQRSV